MDHGRAPDSDDMAALEAVWGREASAAAPGAPRPDIDAIFDPGPEPTGDAPSPSRRRRGPLLAGLAIALAAVVAVPLLLLGDEDEHEPDAGGQPASSVISDPGPRQPAWTAPVACRPAPDGGSDPICPVAADAERAYALVDRDGTATVEARAVEDGAVAWETAFPEGAAVVGRLPSAVLVLGVGPDWLTVGLDPATGTERWRAPGTLVGPVGDDHVLLDELVGADLEERGAMTVVEAATGRVVVTREGTPAGLFVHPCGEAGLAIVRQDGRLTAVGVPGGAERWSVPVDAVLDVFHRVHCDETTVAYVAGGALHLLDAATGAQIGTTTVAPADAKERVTVLAVEGRTVVVGSSDGARGFRADAGLEQLWRLRCVECGPDLPVAAAGDDVLVVIGDQAVVRRGSDGASGPRLDLAGGTATLPEGGGLLAWSGGEVRWVDTADVGHPVVIGVDGVRATAAGPTHVVVSTGDELRAYPLEG